MEKRPLVSGKILKWGNSYGIRLTKAEMERAGLKPGAEATFRVSHGAVDLSAVTFYRGGSPEDSKRHDELLGQARSRRRGA